MEFDNTEIEFAVRQLRNENQIISKEILGITGTTASGLQVWFPDSFQRGYHDGLTHISERPKMVWNIFGVVGYFTDDHFNYLPTYNQGLQHAQEVKTNVIAVQTWKLTQKSTEQEKKIENLEKTVDDLRKKLDDESKNKM